MQYREFSAWVEIAGVEAKEYNIQVSDDDGVPKSTCWISSESDKVRKPLEFRCDSTTFQRILVSQEFTVNWKDSIASSAVAGRVKVDGRDSHDGRVARQGNNLLSTTTGFRTAGATLRPFVFARLNTTGMSVVLCPILSVFVSRWSLDEDEYLDVRVSQDTGDIELTLQRVQILGPGLPSASTSATVPEDLKYHERTKKALVHQVGYVFLFAPLCSTRSRIILQGRP